MTKPKQVEQALEHVLFNARWLMAPFYAGLAVALLLLLYHFIVQLAAFVGGIGQMDEGRVILGILGLIDLSFTGNLILIVIFSGYENFVSRIDVGTRDRPVWMTKIDFGGLKQKLMASIVAISVIQVLKGSWRSRIPMRCGSAGWSASTWCFWCRCWSLPLPTASANRASIRAKVLGPRGAAAGA